MNIADIISDAWQQEKLPVINGLIKACGSFYELDMTAGCKLVEKDFKVAVFDMYSSVYYRSEVTYRNTIFYCGGGSMGGDGWLLAINDNDPQWLFFSENVNPFEKVRVENNEIHVMNNMGNDWIFPVDKPEKMRY